jgi:hypothetical protein
MTDNVTVREPEAARDDSGDDRSNRQPVATDARAEPAAPATPDKVSTADTAAAGGVAPSDAPATSDSGGAARSEAPATQHGDEAAAPPLEGDAANRRASEREAPGDGGPTASLFGGDQASTYRSRWQEIQTGFVDEPKAAVQEADALVAEVMRQLARTFADERRGLEGQWAEGEEISTEDLRIALRRYRSFFDRLLSV